MQSSEFRLKTISLITCATDGLAGLHFVVKPNHLCIAGGFTFMKAFQSIAWVMTAQVAALPMIQKEDAINPIVFLKTIKKTKGTTMSQFKKLIILVLPVLFILAGQSEAASRRYEIKSGYVKYENSNGTDELFWDNYGEKEARYSETTINVMGMTNTSQSIDIIDGEWSYNYDPATNIATRYNQVELMQKMTGSQSRAPRDFSDEMLESLGGVKVGTETILNKNTDVYQLQNLGNFKVWVYKGVSLKSEGSMMGMTFTSQAVELEENVEIEEAKLVLPEGAEIVEGDLEEIPNPEEMREAQEQMLEMQNDPEVQEAMQQMEEIQNSAEYQDAMQQMQEMQNDPQYEDALNEVQQYQKTGKTTKNSNTMTDKAGSIIQQETNAAVEDTIRSTTRDGVRKALGGGLKSIFNN